MAARYNNFTLSANTQQANKITKDMILSHPRMNLIICRKMSNEHVIIK